AQILKADNDDKSITLIIPYQVGRQVAQEHKKFDLAEDAKIRSNYVPEQTDDKGKPKKLTAAELKKLKGDDPRLPGYALEFGQLAPPDMAKATLGKEKPAPKTKEKSTKASDDKSAKPADDKLYITMILVTSPPKKK